jgi:hypothetical protein
MPADNDIQIKLDAKVKEPRAILFFRGALFQFTYNDQMRGFTQSSLCVLFSLPSRECVEHFQRIKVLAAPPGIKDHTFDKNETLDEYIEEGWFETYVHTAPERPISMGNGIQAQRRQYGMKHRVTSIIHGSMGDILTLDDVALSNLSVDRITQFSLRPPELRDVIDRVGNYYRWFSISKKRMKAEEIHDTLRIDLIKTLLIDGLQRQIKIRSFAIDELGEYLKTELIEFEIALQSDPHIIEMNRYLTSICTLCIKERRGDELDERESAYLIHINDNILERGTEHEHLPVTVYSFTKSTMGIHFIVHILLSMGSFKTELDLFMQASLRECLRHAKLIGPSNEPSDLQRYSNELTKKFIIEQLVYFPNCFRVLASWITTCGELLDDIIIRDEIPITDMPAVQYSTLYDQVEAESVALRKEIKSNTLLAAFKELGEELVVKYNIPEPSVIEVATKESPITWNPIDSFQKSDNQSELSFQEQKLALKICKQAIDSYLNIFDQYKYTKNIGIRGFPGSGKTYCMQYMAFYCLCQGLNCIPMAILAKRANFLGGKHWHWLFCIPTERGLSLHRKAELAIIKIMKNAAKYNILQTLDVILADEIGQLSSEFIATIDLILRRIRDNNIFFGGVLIISTLDHTQIRSIDGHPFLTSMNVISCFKMVELKTSVRASGDEAWKRIQHITRMNYQNLRNDPSRAFWLLLQVELNLPRILSVSVIR